MSGPRLWSRRSPLRCSECRQDSVICRMVLEGPSSSPSQCPSTRGNGGVRRLRRPAPPVAAASGSYSRPYASCTVISARSGTDDRLRPLGKVLREERRELVEGDEVHPVVQVDV